MTDLDAGNIGDGVFGAGSSVEGNAGGTSAGARSR
jgi:hypothetical protein